MANNLTFDEQIKKRVEYALQNGLKMYVPYKRVSTDKQGESGLGLEAQDRDIAAATSKGVIIASFTEVESRSDSQRTELLKAIAVCKKYNASIVIAKVDRLTDDSLLMNQLLKSKVNIVPCDMPDASPFVLRFMTAIAEEEVVKLRKRTKSALNEIKQKIKEQGFHTSKKGNKITSLGRQIEFETEQAKKDYFSWMANKRTYSVKNETAVILCQSLFKNGLKPKEIKQKLESLPDNSINISLRTVYGYIKRGN